MNPTVKQTLQALADDEEHTLTELSKSRRISTQTAHRHCAVLISEGFVSVEQRTVSNRRGRRVIGKPTVNFYRITEDGKRALHGLGQS